MTRSLAPAGGKRDVTLWAATSRFRD